MPKIKAQFSKKKINKKKAPLPVSRFQKIKRFLNSWSIRQRFGILVLAVLGVGFLNHYQGNGFSYLFKADLLQSPAPFNGTVFPVDKVPNWTKWKGNHYMDHYSSIDNSMLIPLPAYDLTELQFPDEDLVWGNATHDDIRNTKITYPVVYLGNYDMDYKENAGSHLAVDMKMPIGTPVKAIANGRVVKVSMTESGFGHHVVIEHKDVPSMADPNKKITLYSGFNHMDKIHVTQGQIVSKGEIIGTSGNTGTSTTPHLHFQIDTAEAPWHPYWPFSSAESQQAGLSFFEAVNAGLGLTSAQKYTVNPLVYVKKFLSYHANTPYEPVQEPVQEPAPIPYTPPVNEPEVTPSPVVPSSSDNGVDTDLFEFTFTGDKIGFVNSGVWMTAHIDPSDLSKMSETDVVEVKISGMGQMSKKQFKKTDFLNASVKFNVDSSQAGLMTVEMGKSIFEITFITEVKPISALRVDSDGNFERNIEEELTIVALDSEGNPTPIANFLGVISLTSKEGQADFTPLSLQASDFANGVAKVKMRVNESKRVIVRAQQGALLGESEALSMEVSEGFPDVPPSHPNYKAIKALEQEGVINGYPDGSFGPDNVVVRVEALKMLMLAFDVKAGESKELPFIDTDEKAWYANTLATAFQKEIVEGYADGTFKPGKTVNIAELFKMLFETNGIKPNEDLQGMPYKDVSTTEWYAGYAYLINKKNLMDVEDGNLRAASGMTRKDVAEAIYRMKYILENGAVTYAN